MKKSFIILLFIITATSCAYGQNLNKEDTPMLIRISQKEKFAPRLEIQTSCVKDTLRLFAEVMVRFDEKFSDSVRLTTPKEIYLYNLSYSNMEGKRIHFPDLEEQSPEQICIWSICDAQFKIWMKEQPYSDMYDIERFYGYSAFVLAYPVFLIPE